MKINLEVQGLSKHFQRAGKPFIALDDIGFSVEEGETLGIIGRNGAGKSTLLRILAGITKPTAGTIHSKGSIGAILDLGWGFHPQLSGFENIIFAAQLMGISKQAAKQATESIMDFAELTPDILSMPVHTFSSGMYLRLAFATVMAFPRQVMLLDEVLAVGDFRFQFKATERIFEIQKQGHSLLMVSHALEMLSTMSNRLLVLEKGKMNYIGDPILAMKSYQNINSQDIDNNTEKFPPGVKLLSVEVLGTHVPDSDAYDAAYPICLRLHWETDKTLKQRVDLGLSIINHLGLRLFVDGTVDWPLEQVQGERVLEWTIPANILNEGIYTLFLVWLIDKTGFNYQDEVSFKVSNLHIFKAVEQREYFPFYLQGALKRIS